MDAVSLNSTVSPGTRFAGPFLGGLLMAQVRFATGDPLLGPAVLFYLTALGYVMNAFFLYRIHFEPVALERAKASVIRDMTGGVRFIALNPISSALILMTYCTQFFGWSFQSLFTIFAKDIFKGEEFEIGLTGSVLGAGSLIGATITSNLPAYDAVGRC